MLKPLYKTFENDYIDFWNLLNVDFNESKESIDIAYNSIKTKNLEEIDEYYVAWKLLQDKNFEKLYKRCKSLNEVYDAGFFLDSLLINEEAGIQSPHFSSAPIHKAKLHSNKKNIVLISTGGFSPVHDGHIFTLETAKAELERDGYHVVCGYISPSHDHYVSTKDSGKAHNPALNRIRLCNEKIQNSSWIMTSPHESVYTRTSINYTDVIRNIKKYVKTNISENIIIGYVFGGDNAPFIKAFEDTEDLAICVTRNNERESFIKPEDLSHCNYKYIEKNPYFEESSTKIRNKKEIETKRSKAKNNNNYLIRNDYKMFDMPEDLSPIVEIKKLFNECLNNSKVYEIEVSEQMEMGEKKKAESKNKTISLDVYLKGDINASLSRIFNNSDSQIKANGLVKRPETNKNVDLSRLNEDKYTLIEDDIVSGFTLSHLKSMMPKGVIIEDYILLSDFGINGSQDHYDVVDLRDFIINVEFSGLVVDIKGEQLRVPYISPYVDLTTRESILPEKAIYFSKMILEINIKMYNEIKKRKIDIELTQSIETLCSIIGIKKENNNIDTVINFCNWHLEKIKGIC